MEFEWDDHKNDLNVRKHGVDFIDAAQIFHGQTLEFRDGRQDYAEERFIAVGSHNDLKMILVVVYTWRGDNRRIISAWKGGRDEERAYCELLARSNHDNEGAD